MHYELIKFIFMIIVRLLGGIGNQLFQYSFGEYLKRETNQIVTYDIGTYGRSDKNRECGIRIINNDILTIDNVKFSHYRGIKNRLYRFLFMLNKNNVYIDESKMKDNLYFSDKLYYLQGYWQNTLYIDKSNDFFQPKESIPFEIESILKVIENSIEPVFIHIRRGDYFSPKNQSIYGVCDADYYHRAIRYMNDNVDYDRLFIFSDDYNWVKTNMILPNNIYFVPNCNVNHYWYIYLMSKCNHSIISNSTFSWWGAYLNEKSNKIVVAPKIWINGSNTTLALTDWIKL